MFYKKLANGKYRYYEKYWNESEEKWKQVSVTYNSKTRAVQAEARRVLEEKIKEKNNVKSLHDLTVKEVYDEWLVIRKMELKPSTLRTQTGVMRTFLQKFGSQRLTALKSTSLQKYLLAKNWSYFYRVLYKCYLSSLFGYVKKVGYLEENIMDKVVLPKHKVTREEIEKKRERYLNRKQMRLYLDILSEKGTTPVFNVLVEFLYLTGLRVGEAQALRWSDVDFENKILAVRHTLQLAARKQDYKITSPKTIHSYREIYMSNRVVELLEEVKRMATVKGDKDLVFVDGRGDFFSLTTFNRYIKRYFDNQKIGKSDSFRLTSHVFRHSHISLLTELGFHVREIMERVGHSDEKTTIQIYTHVTENMKKESYKKLDDVTI